MFKPTDKILPFSGGRYYVTEQFDVVDEKGCIIPLVEKDGTWFVELAWYDGVRLYEKALVVLSAYGRINYSDVFYNKVNIVYIDGDKSNCFLVNLLYVFSEPIETHITGYYHIPEYPMYAISRNGDVINLETGKLKTIRIFQGNPKKNQKPGYVMVSLIKGTSYIHRLLALVFLKLPIDIPFKKLTVNHIDGSKDNNNLSNLEWSTYSENNKHAWRTGLIYGKKDRFLVRNLVTGQIKEYRSPKQYSLLIGDSSAHYTSARLRDKSGKIYPDLLQFKYDDGTPWPEIDSSLIPEFEEGFVNNFVARNVFTGDITIFGDARESEQLFNIPARIVLDHARNSKLLPYKGYNFRYLSEREKFPEHSKRHLEVYKETPIGPASGVIVYDHYEEKEYFFPSIQKCLDKFDMKFAHLSTLCFTGDRWQKGRYSFKRFKLMEEVIKDNQQPSLE